MTNRSVRVTLSADVSGFQTSLGKAQNSVETLTTKIGKASQSETWKAATTGLLAFGATATSVAILAAKKFADFDEQMSAVRATGADAKDNIDELTQAAIGAGEAFGQFDARQAAQGLEALLKAGVSARDVLDGGLNGTLAMAAAGQMEVGAAAELTAISLAQFKLSGDKAAKVADLLAAGAGKAVGDVKDIGDALKMSGTVANQFGISIEETVGTLAMFAQNAMIGSDAGTSLKTMLMRLASPTTEARRTMESLGLAAYDAQGNFVGLEHFAGQLKTQMAGLTQEQRNAALETMFGADAIRAASILYSEGAEGVRHWRDEVSEQGYASMMAAEMTDNLKGDILELGGTFETAMIQIGTASNSGLRTAVQGLTDLVSVISANSDTAATVVSIAAAIGGLAITAGVVGKGATAFFALKASVEAAGMSMAGLTFKTGVVGLAIGALAAVVGHYALKAAKAKADADGFADAIRGQTNAVNDGTRALVAKSLQESGALDLAKKHGIAAKDVADAAFGEAEAHERVTEALQAKIDALRTEQAGMSSYERDQSARGRELAKQLSELDVEKRKIIDTINQQNTAFEAGKNAIDNEAAAAGEATGPTSELAAAQRRLEEATGAANNPVMAQADLLAEARNQLMLAANEALALSDANIGMEASFDAASDTIAENIKKLGEHGKTLDLDTEAGRANQQALDRVVGSHNKLIEEMTKQGATSEELRGKTVRAREEFIRVVGQLGITGQAAEDLANKYGLIPTEVITGISTPGSAESIRDAKALREAIEQIPPEKRPQVISVFNREGIAGAERELRAIDGRVANTFINTIRTTVIRERYEYGGSPTAGGGFVAMKASGGYIMGPGTATSDSIPAWLSNGEFVQRAAAVDYYGRDFMARLNTLQIPKDNLPRFAQGGPVDGARWSTFDRSPRMTYRPVPAQNTVGGQVSRNINIANLSVQLDGIESVQDIVRFGDMLEANAVRASAGRVHG